jgi:predicted dithiol-disulfide oxidoreductase (DUF899 family)
MSTQEIPHPPITNESEWLSLRKELLTQEKELIHQKDRVNAARRRLPMVKVEKDYTFDGPEGKVKLLDLFKGKHQLIVHHFMFDPAWEKGCPGCTGHVDSFGDLSDLEKRDTTYVIISRAPLEKLTKFKEMKGWTLPWYSSFGSDFNYDYHVTLDDAVMPMEYNYTSEGASKGEGPGFSVFFRVGDEVYHTYSRYARGMESITDSYDFLDLTPYGRQEDFEDSPAGWPQKPTYG